MTITGSAAYSYCSVLRAPQAVKPGKTVMVSESQYGTGTTGGSTIKKCYSFAHPPRAHPFHVKGVKEGN